MKRFTCLLAFMALVPAAYGAATFQDLGTSAPPGQVGPWLVTPFDLTAQESVLDFTSVTTIPGSPVPGFLTVTPAATKLTVPFTWGTWSHGYAGPVFYESATSATMQLPPLTKAFYFYVEPNSFNTFEITATTDDGTTSGPIFVSGFFGANGYAFFSPAVQSIVTVTVVTDPDAGGLALGEFGINASPSPPVPVASQAGLTLLAGTLFVIGFVILRRRYA
jgi:hypothetical protein